MSVSSRRALLAAGAGALMAGAGLADVAVSKTLLPGPPTAGPHPDAELIRICHQFAEAEFTNWYRYVTAPADVADEQDRDPDFDTMHWIEATPATTLEGFQAKALACAAWNREMYDDPEDSRDCSTPVLASLLRDMVTPARNAILARCAAEYGPFPDGYDADWRWIGRSAAPTPVAAPVPVVLPDAALIRCCERLLAVDAEREALCRVDPHAPDHGPLNAAYDRLCAERGDLKIQIEDCDAPSTAAGARALARVALSHADRDSDGKIMPRGLMDYAAITVAMWAAGGDA